MGAVWVVEQLSTGKLRALKLLHVGMDGAEARRRFAQEARVGAQIASEHVVEVVAAGEDGPDGRPWLVMELLEGEDLAARVDRQGRLSIETSAEILAQLCHGLAAAHDARIVHRDLKPENVFLASSRLADRALLVKILDFGIAKVTSTGVGSTGAIGTPLWMAPEQTDPSGTVTPATDVWALGLLAFHLLTGGSYWVSAYSEEIVPAKLLRELLIEPLEAASARAARLGLTPLPAGFDSWFARCVARSPSERHANAREAWQALAPLLGVRASDPALFMHERSSTGPMASMRTELAPSRPVGRAATSEGITLPTEAKRPRAVVLAMSGMLVGILCLAAFFGARRAGRAALLDRGSPSEVGSEHAAPAVTAAPASAAPAVEPQPAVALPSVADAGRPSAPATQAGGAARRPKPTGVTAPATPAAPAPVTAPKPTPPVTKKPHDVPDLL